MLFLFGRRLEVTPIYASCSDIAIHPTTTPRRRVQNSFYSIPDFKASLNRKDASIQLSDDVCGVTLFYRQLIGHGFRDNDPIYTQPGVGFIEKRDHRRVRHNAGDVKIFVILAWGQKQRGRVGFGPRLFSDFLLGCEFESFKCDVSLRLKTYKVKFLRL
jgi:hypothetical protein